MTNKPAKALGVFSLAMITAVSVDSIRNLPATALFGSSLIFFFIMASIFFLIPSALISAELSSSSNEHGGIYVWVKNAFGKKAGFFAIWFQWVENIIWYPTILSFVAGTIGYLVSPALAESKTFLIVVILCAFWGATLVNWMGIKTSAVFSNFCAVCGLLIPMALIIMLGIIWIVVDRPLQIHFTAESVLPHLTNSGMWVAMTGIILSFGGMEIATVHGMDVSNPKRSYPRAMLLATVIIVITLLCGALSIAIVLPEQKISLVAGIMEAFHAFFSAYHMDWIQPVIAVMLVVGGMGGVNNWIIAPTRGLLIAGQDGHLPKHFQKQNKHQAPSVLLLYQAIVVTMISMIFLFMPTVNASYWLLTALAAQLYMVMYLFMFAAAIRLRYKKEHQHDDGYRIPGGYVGMWIVGSAGFLGSLVTFVIGFIPPATIDIGSVWHYESFLIVGLLIMSIPAFFLKNRTK